MRMLNENIAWGCFMKMCMRHDNFIRMLHEKVEWECSLRMLYENVVWDENVEWERRMRKFWNI